MAKLVILNQGMAGRTFELNVDRTTVGRVEDNTFQIADPSVSSHHAEILLRGSEVLIKDLNSTNGTFINGEKVTEAILKPGQILRFGQVELKIDDGTPAPPPSAVPSAAAPKPPAQPAPKATVDGTMLISRGVSLTDLEHSGANPSGFDTNASFSKKSNKTNKYFILGGIVIGLIILGLILYLVNLTGSPAR